MIHPQAIVDPTAEIHESVEVGPFTLIGSNVKIGAGTVIGANNVIKGPTIIGKNNRFFQFCSIGEDTPDLKYKGELTELVIGDGNTFREFCSVHRGTVQDKGITLIGNDNLIMTYAHVAHDCVVANNCIISNSAALAGHVHLGDSVIVSASAGIHQYCKIGEHSFIGAYSAVFQDVPAYIIVQGAPAIPRIVNAEGLRRRGFSGEDVKQIQLAFKTLYKRKLSLSDAVEKIQLQMEKYPIVAPFYDSIVNAKRSIVR